MDLTTVLLITVVLSGDNGAYEIDGPRSDSA
jgi:hypothetical protein